MILKSEFERNVKVPMQQLYNNANQVGDEDCHDQPQVSEQKSHDNVLNINIDGAMSSPDGSPVAAPDSNVPDLIAITDSNITQQQRFNQEQADNINEALKQIRANLQTLATNETQRQEMKTEQFELTKDQLDKVLAALEDVKVCNFNIC